MGHHGSPHLQNLTGCKEAGDQLTPIHGGFLKWDPSHQVMDSHDLGASSTSETIRVIGSGDPGIRRIRPLGTATTLRHFFEVQSSRKEKHRTLVPVGCGKCGSSR